MERKRLPVQLSLFQRRNGAYMFSGNDFSYKPVVGDKKVGSYQGVAIFVKTTRDGKRFECGRWILAPSEIRRIQDLIISQCSSFQQQPGSKPIRVFLISQRVTVSLNVRYDDDFRRGWKRRNGKSKPRILS